LLVYPPLDNNFSSGVGFPCIPPNKGLEARELCPLLASDGRLRVSINESFMEVSSITFALMLIFGVALSLTLLDEALLIPSLLSALLLFFVRIVCMSWVL
jgi:hypothetical protein